MRRQSVKFPWDLYWKNKTYKLNNEYVQKCCTPTVPLKTIPDSKSKWAKSISVFRPKRCKNHSLWGATYLYVLYNGVPPPPLPKKQGGSFCQSKCTSCKRLNIIISTLKICWQELEVGHKSLNRTPQEGDKYHTLSCSYKDFPL